MINTPNDLLDDLLCWYAYDENSRPGGTANEATRDFHERHHRNESTMFIGNLRENVISKAIWRLEKDRYIVLRGIEQESGQRQYTVTFDGLVFISEGGYRTQSKKESTLRQLRSLEKIVLALGAAIGAVYALSELFGPFPKPDMDIKAALILLLFGATLGAIILLLIQELVGRRPK